MIISKDISAQYSKDKLLYNYKSYSYDTNDKYHPIISGVASYIVPGLGQIYCNENRRGYNFLAGYCGAIVLMSTGALIQLPESLNPENNNPESVFFMDGSLGSIMILSGVISAFGIQIWSSIDAVKVAKVKNLSIRNRDSSSIKVHFKPFINKELNCRRNSIGIVCVIAF